MDERIPARFGPACERKKPKPYHLLSRYVGPPAGEPGTPGYWLRRYSERHRDWGLVSKYQKREGAEQAQAAFERTYHWKDPLDWEWKIVER